MCLNFLNQNIPISTVTNNFYFIIERFFTIHNIIFYLKTLYNYLREIISTYKLTFLYKMNIVKIKFVWILWGCGRVKSIERGQ